MTHSTEILTLPELETLCQLYMDCRLSVAEETELEYVLGHTQFSSPLIAETRRLMGIVHSLSVLKKTPQPRRGFRHWIRIYGAAACIASLLVLGTVIFTTSDNYNTSVHPGSVNVMIAYCNGRKLNDVEAHSAVNQAMNKADSLMNLAAEIEHRNAIQAQHIMNLTSD